MTLFSLLALLVVLQSPIPLKPSTEFEIKTNFELKTKPGSDNPVVVFDAPQKPKSGTSDQLPYLTLQLKVKKWSAGVSQIKVVDGKGKLYVKKKPTDESQYIIDMGFVDDIKDRVTSGKFFVTFLKEKKPVEQITIEVEEDGTFLVNNEKRGKF